MKPCFEKAEPQPGSGDANDGDTLTQDGPPLANLFENLEIFDTAETEQLFSTYTEDENSRPPPAATGSREPRHYHIEKQNSTAEMYFAAHLLFTDLHALRGYVHEIWYDYGAEKVDLIACAVTTNSAFDLARRAADDFASDFPKTPIENIIMAFYFMQCKQCDLDPKGGENFDGLEAAQWVYVSAYSLLSRFRQALKGNSSTIAICKPGYFGCYDPDTDPAKMTAEERFQNTKALTAELLSDFALVTRASSGMPVEDEITRGFRELSNTGTISLGFMFAYQVFLDLQQVFGSNCNALWDLQQSGRKIYSTLSTHLNFHRNLKIGTWQAQNDNIIEALLSDVSEWAMQDAIGEPINDLVSIMLWPPLIAPFLPLTVQ